MPPITVRSTQTHSTREWTDSLGLREDNEESQPEPQPEGGKRRFYFKLDSRMTQLPVISFPLFISKDVFPALKPMHLVSILVICFFILKFLLGSVLC